MDMEGALANFLKQEHQERINTSSFFQELQKVDLSINPIVTYNIDLDFDEFLQFIHESNFFEVLSFRDGEIFHVFDDVTADKLDYAKSSQFFCFHTDGQELPHVPEIALLYCIDEGDTHTPTVFADSIQLIKILKEKNLMNDLEKCDFIFRDRTGHEYRRPIIEKHPLTSWPIMNVALGSNQCKFELNDSYSEEFLDTNKLYDQVSDIAENELTLIPHFYKTGQIVVFDNNRIIHGRGLPEEKYKMISDKKRHLARMWLNYRTHHA